MLKFVVLVSCIIPSIYSENLPRVENDKLFFLPPQETPFTPVLDSGEPDFGVMGLYYGIVSIVKDFVFPGGIPWEAASDMVSSYVKQIEEMTGATNLTFEDLLDGNTLENITNKLDTSQITPDKAIEFVTGSLVSVAVFILIIIVMLIFIACFPCFALGFCCLRLCGKCGGKLEQKSPSTIIFAVFLALTIANTLAMGGLMMTYGAASNTFNSDHPAKLIDFVDDVQEDMKNFLKNTLNDTKVTVLNTLGFGETVVLDLIEAAPNRLFLNFFNEIKNNLLSASTSYDADVEAFTTAFGNLVSLQKQMYYNDTTTDSLNMKSISDLIQEAVDDLRSGTCNGTCATDVLPELEKHIITPPVPIVSLSAIPTVKTADMLNTVFDEVDGFINSTISSSLTQIKSAIADNISPLSNMIGGDVDRIIEQLNDFDYKDHTDTVNISEISKTIDDTALARTAAFMPYMLPGMFITFITVVGLILGLIGKFTKPTAASHERSMVSNIGGCCLTGSGLLSFLLAYFYLVSTFPLFVAVTPSGLLCNDIKDETIFKSTIDRDYLTNQKSFLGQIVYGDGNKELKISGFFDDCRKGKGIFETIPIDEFFNISDFVNISEIIDPSLLTGALSALDFSTFDLFPPALQATTQTLVDALELLPTAINNLTFAMNTSVGAYIHQLQNDVAASLDPLEKFIKTNCTSSPCKSLNNIAASLESFNADPIVFPTAKSKIAEAIARVANLSSLLNDDYIGSAATAIVASEALVNATGDNTTGFIGAIVGQQTFLVQNGTANLTQEATLFMDVVKSYIDQFLDYFLDSVAQDLIKCNVFVNIWDALWTNLCDYGLLEVEGIYLPATCIGLISFTHIIFTLKLAKYFRTMKSPATVSPVP